MANNYSTPQISPDLLIRQDNIALVYMTDDKQFDVRIKLGEDTVVSPECEAFLAKARIAETASTNFLSLDNRQFWKRMLGESMSLAISSDLKAAEEIADRAERFLRDRAVESAHMWYVQACLALIATLVATYLMVDVVLMSGKGSDTALTSESEKDSALVNPSLDDTTPITRSENSIDDTSSDVAASPGQASIHAKNNANIGESQKRSHKNSESMAGNWDEDDTYTLKYLLAALIGGAVGAGFSLLVRVGKLPVDPAAGRQAHYGEVLFRMTIGAIAGVIIIVGWQAEVFATFMRTDPIKNESGETVMRASEYSFNMDYWKLIILAIAAGASERLVPSLLNQLAAKNTADRDSPAQDAASSQ